MKHPLIDVFGLIVDWSPANLKYRKFKFRHHKSSKGIYIQILALEIATWYGNTYKPKHRGLSRLAVFLEQRSFNARVGDRLRNRIVEDREPEPCIECLKAEKRLGNGLHYSPRGCYSLGS